MRRLTIMQGRLTPPRGGRIQAFPGKGWERELELAAAAGLDGLELIYEEFQSDHNPLASDAGMGELAAAAERSGVVARSVCADRLLESPVVSADGGGEAVAGEMREALARWAGAVERVVLPFVDANSAAEPDALEKAVGWVESLLPPAGQAGIELHLETDLAPAEFAALLARLESPLVRVNYDTGNSAALGYDPTEEFEAYGERIGSVHVKDRVRGGATVPLGEGDAQIGLALGLLRERGYGGDVVLQVARDEDGAEPAWARRNAAIVRELWAR
jgi:hexulose-6-phosphate isomerase